MNAHDIHPIAYLWPGAAHIWRRGSWAGLALACAFGFLVEGLAAATLVWTEWLPPRLLAIGWSFVAGIWILSYLEARADWRRLAQEWTSRDTRTLAERQAAWFVEAQQSYLRGDWALTERRLHDLLRCDARDIEARLFLATLKRRQAEYAEAHEHLAQLDRWEASSPWRWEIDREWQRLRESVATTSSQDAAEQTAAGAESVVDAQQLPPDVSQASDSVHPPSSLPTEPSTDAIGGLRIVGATTTHEAVQDVPTVPVIMKDTSPLPSSQCPGSHASSSETSIRRAA
ncbi:MAG: hypothetical protein KDA61_14745 [Planctomycetales bacterium]|nr:hypothetical protein [Planctomycetales bacterium]